MVVGTDELAVAFDESGLKLKSLKIHLILDHLLQLVVSHMAVVLSVALRLNTDVLLLDHRRKSTSSPVRVANGFGIR